MFYLQIKYYFCCVLQLKCVEKLKYKRKIIHPVKWLDNLKFLYPFNK